MDWANATRIASERARASGALAPIDTYAETLSEHGLAYVVRVLRNVRRKHVAGGDTRVDPFAPPYEPDLVIGALPPAHMALLNKFPALDRHLLAVTREFKSQTSLLTVSDCEALLGLLHGWDGLVFYNGGPDAGASQPHKHLQMIDFSFISAGSALSVMQTLAADDPDDGIGYSPSLPFPHARIRIPTEAWNKPRAGASAVHGLYLDLLDAVGLPPDDGLEQQPGPYNLLATREWLWLVPRRRQSCRGIEVNALGFAGTLLVPDNAHLAILKRMGPSACLRAVCP